MGNVFAGNTMSKDAITAYNNFLCTYGLLHAEMLPNDAIQSATRIWCNFLPEQQMSYALMYPSHPNCFDYEVRSECVKPPCAVALRKRCAQNKPKRKLKAKMTATKCPAKKTTPVVASKRSPTRRLRPASKRIKSKAKTKREPPEIGFQTFFKKLRDKHCEIREEDIIKKAARAWCNMSQRQRKSFLR